MGGGGDAPPSEVPCPIAFQMQPAMAARQGWRLDLCTIARCCLGGVFFCPKQEHTTLGGSCSVHERYVHEQLLSVQVAIRAYV